MKVFKAKSEHFPVLPEPDPDIPPAGVGKRGDLVVAPLELGRWIKGTVHPRAGAASSGWVETRHLDEIAQTLSGDIELYDEPLGDTSRKVSGLTIPTGLSAADWQKVFVLRDDSSLELGWTNSPDLPVPPSPDTNANGDGDGEEGNGAPRQPATQASLRLGINEVYRDALLKAQKLTGINAAALAALINAEAGFIASGPNKGRWNSDAVNSASGAAGLTQFLASTWLDRAERKKTVLNKRLAKLAFLTSAGKLKASRREKCLQLRFDPELSILCAAEYGLENLRYLEKKGLVPSGIDDDKRAWFMYLAHHEGAGGAEGFLNGTRIYSANDLRIQVGDDAISRIQKAGGDANKAYRDWLTEYMERKIQPEQFRGGRAQPASQHRERLANFADTTLPLSTIGGDKALAIAIQDALTNLGYLDPPADGLFGQISHWALREFCSQNGLALGGGFTRSVATALLDPANGLPQVKLTGSWFDKIVTYMQANDYFICRHPEAQNIVYVEGMNEDGTLNNDAPNKFNDLRIVFTVDAQGKVQYDIWDGTTEPSQYWTVNPMNPKGAARIAFNQYKSWRVGTHRAGTSGAHEALVQVQDVTVHRDLDQNYIRTNDRTYTGMYGINQHWGYDLPKDDLGRSSAGCLVGRTKTGHRAFMRRIKKDPRYQTNKAYKFVTSILPGDML